MIKQNKVLNRNHIKELVKHLCALDNSWVQGAFRHTLTAALEALSMTREDP